MRTPEEYYQHAPIDGSEPAWLRRLSSLPGFCPESRAEVAARYLNRGHRVLDYGCGEGSFLHAHARERFERAVGVDLSEASVQYARDSSPGGDNSEFLRIDPGRDLPFDDASFDCVVSLAVLEHVFWPIGLLAEFQRVLRPGGRLIVEVPNVGWVWHRLQLVLLGRFPDTAPGTGRWPGVDDGHIRFFTVHALQSLVEEAGFRIVTTSCAGRVATLRRRWVSMLGADIILVADRT